MNLEKFDPTRLKNALHFQFHSEIIDLINATGVANLHLEPFFTAHVPIFHEEDIALKRIVKSAKTRLIHDADRLRDETWSGFVEIVKGNTKHFNPLKREAAIRIKIVTDTYGNVAIMGLNEETSNMYNVLQDLRSQRYAADVATIGVGEWITALAEQNSALDNLMKERFQEFGSQDHTAVREIRGRMDKSYHAMIDNTNAHILLEGVAEYEPYVRTHNAIVARYKLYGKRHRHEDSADDAAAEPLELEEQGA